MVEFKPRDHRQKWCKPECRDAWMLKDRIPVICFRCDTEFSTTRDIWRKKQTRDVATVCPTCLIKEGASKGGMATKKIVQIKLSDVPKVQPPKTWCNTCKFGEESSHSDTGWICQRNAAQCKPWAEVRLYEPKYARV